LQWSSVWRASQIYKKQKGKQFFLASVIEQA